MPQELYVDKNATAGQCADWARMLVLVGDMRLSEDVPGVQSASILALLLFNL